MKFTKLTPNISVAHQLTEQDLEAAAAAGFKTIINNRPDGEAPDQPPSEEIAAAAKRLGLAYHHIPAVSGQISNNQVEAFRTALGGAEKPALAFCRTGTRSTYLWALARAQLGDGRDELIEKAAAAGYDLRPIAMYLRPGV